MKVLVCGQRDFNDPGYMFGILDRIHELTPITLIVEGGAQGADQFGGSWAISRGVELKVFPANWKQYGKAAGPIRNRQQFDETQPDRVLAFYHDMSTSKGTKDMVAYAQSKNCETSEYVTPMLPIIPELQQSTNTRKPH